MEQCNYKVCINCLHVYLEKTKSPQKQQPWQQRAPFVAGGCNCVGKGEAETSPGLLPSAADVLGLEPRLRQALSPAAPSTCHSISMAPAQHCPSYLVGHHQSQQAVDAWTIPGDLPPFQGCCHPLRSSLGKTSSITTEPFIFFS